MLTADDLEISLEKIGTFFIKGPINYIETLACDAGCIIEIGYEVQETTYMVELTEYTL